MPRVLTTILLAAFFLYGAYWFIGKSTREQGLERWFDERAAAGWVADTEVELKGFPNRYDAVMTDLNLADPASGWAWSAPRFELMQLSYQPNHYIARWPQSQTVSSPDQKINVISEDLRASIIFEPRSDFIIDRATLTANTIDIQSTANWGAASEDLVLALRQSTKGEAHYDLAVKTSSFRPSNALLLEIDRARVMPESFQLFELSAVAAFADKLSRNSFNNNSADLTHVDLEGLNLEWGDLAFRAAGEFDVDAEGYPSGRITVRAENWERILDMAIAADVVNVNFGETLRSGLSLLARFSGNPDTLDVPLSFTNKETRLGPITLGPAPRLKL